MSLIRCVFSVGGDGELHVLDDADANGYIKPRPTADGRRKNPTKKSSSTTGRRLSGEAEDSNQNDKAGNSDNDEPAGEQGGRGRERRSMRRRSPSVHEGRELEDRASNTAGRADSGGAGAGARAASERSRAARAALAGGKKNADGGRSVLLRQVAFAYDSDDNDDGKGEGESTVEGTSDSDSRTDERGSDVSYQQPRGMDGASKLQPDGGDALPVELHGGSTATTKSFTK